MDALREVQNLIPAWQLDRQLFYIPYAALITLAVGLWAAAVLTAPIRALPATLHWTERARLVFPARLGMIRLMLYCPLVAGLMAWIYAGPLSRWSVWKLGLTAASATLAATLLPAFLVWCGVSPRRLNLKDWFRSVATFWLLVWPHWGVAILAAAFLPPDSRTAPLVALAVAASLLLWINFGGGLWIARQLGLGRPARPKVVAAIHDAAVKAGVPAPQVLEIAWATANTMAIRSPRCVLVSEPAAARLTEAELAGSSWYLFRYLAEPDLARATRIGLTLTPLIFVNAKFILIHVFPLAPLLSLGGFALLRWAGSRVLKRWGASRDPDPESAPGFALGQERLYEMELVPVVTSDDPQQKRANLYDRLTAAGISPTYQRPSPPTGRGLTPGEQLATLAVALLVPALLLGPQHLTEPQLLAHAAIRADTFDLESLARISVAAGRWDRAELYLRADAEVDRKSVFPVAQLARVRAAQGHCREAEEALEEAERRNKRYHAYADAARALARARREVPGCAPGRDAPRDSAPRRPAGTYSQR